MYVYVSQHVTLHYTTTTPCFYYGTAVCNVQIQSWARLVLCLDRGAPTLAKLLFSRLLEWGSVSSVCMYVCMYVYMYVYVYGVVVVVVVVKSGTVQYSTVNSVPGLPGLPGLLDYTRLLRHYTTVLCM